MAQKSWNETGYEPLEGPVMCANNCGLFGSTTTMNLCPKCYRNLIADQERASSITLSADLGVESCSSSADKHPCVDLPFQISALNAQNSHRAPNRCFSCRKRVGLLGFKCRCGNVFCSMHRYSEKHECSFDYKAAGREAIAKANPMVVASKIVRI